MNIAGREIGPSHPPLVVAEIGINHSGNFERARRMVLDAYAAGAECVKFQCRIPDEDLSPAAKTIKPSNADETVYDLFSRCALTEEQDRELKQLAESLGMIYLSTPYSRAGIDRLERLGVAAYKIGSGEARDRSFLIEVASTGNPVIVSTGMSTREETYCIMDTLDQYRSGYALLHCTSDYPTKHENVRLGCMPRLARRPHPMRSDIYAPRIFGLSDHSPGIWTCLGAVALGASILEKHFTSDKTWPGPDIPVSIGPEELRDLIVGSRAIWEARGGEKTVLPGEAETRRWYEASRRA